MPDVDQLLEAIGEGDMSAIEGLLSTTPELMERRGGWMGQTPLHAAAACGRLEIAEWLLDRGADVNARDDGDNATPLHWAAENGHLDIARLLIARGADVNATDDFHHGGPLGWATTVSKLRPDIAELLMEHGAQMSVFHAIALNDEETVRALAADTASHDTRLEPFAHFELPLHYAVSLGRTGPVRALVESGADVNAVNRIGLTPLAVAELQGHAAVREYLGPGVDEADVSVRLVMRGSIAPSDLESTRFDLALHFAAQRGLTEVARALLEAGADPNRVVEWWRDLHVAPAHPAASYGHLDVVKILVAHGADLTLADSLYQGTPLGWAEQYDREDVVAYLTALS